MVELIRNIGQWFAEHKDVIVATVTSSQFAGFVAAIVMLIKQKNAIKENTNQSKSLEDVIKENEKLCNEVQDLKNLVNEQNEILNDFKDYVITSSKEDNENISMLNDKVNSIIDASSIAWSTIRDEQVRTNVNNILTTAKYREAGKLKDVQTKVVDLQKELLETTQKLQEQIELNAKKVEEVVDFKPTEQNDIVTRV